MTDKRAIRASSRDVRTTFGFHLVPAPAEFRRLLSPGLVVASYVPVRGEADPDPLHSAARAAGCRVALPHVVDRATPLRFLIADEALEPGPFGLLQPSIAAEEVAPDIILTPLVAFDAALNRVGQGAGHYDRAFARYPAAKRIGVAYSVQQVPTIAADPWDMRLDAVVTEHGWVTR